VTLDTIVRVQMQAGTHRFHSVAYDPERDLMELTTRGRWGVEDGLTPDGDVWFLDPADPSIVTGLQVRGARHRQEADGAIPVTLPDGARVRLRGAQRALRAWRVPSHRPLSRRSLRSPRS
jgi:hypothetical protein